MRDVPHASAAVERRPPVGLVLAGLRLPGVDAQPQPSPGQLRAGIPRQGALDLVRGGDGVSGGLEHGHCAGSLAQAVEPGPPVGCHRGVDDPLGSFDGGLGFDVGEHERDRPERRLG